MKLKLLYLFLLIGSMLFSQDNSKTDFFKIVKVGNKYSHKLIKEAVEKSNFCGNFYQTKYNEIIFDDGSIIQLFPKTDINNTNIYSDDCFVSDSVRFDTIKWSISDKGDILKGYAVRRNKSTIKID